MQNIVDIKTRSKSVKETSQITKAMELISVSKLRKANIKYDNNQYYFHKVRATMKDILQHSDCDANHPYFKQDEGEKTAYIIIASDKGLAGDYNHRILKLAMEEIKYKQEKYIFTIGQMARDFFVSKDIIPDVEFLHCAQDPTLEDARRITEDLVYLYESNHIDSVKIIYTQMEGKSTVHPRILHLLPIHLEDFLDVKSESAYTTLLDIQPSPKDVFNILVPQYVLGIVYSCLIQAVSCEHYERIKTMHNATKNANELIKKLDLEYNRARQDAITTEIAEISSSALLKYKE